MDGVIKTKELVCGLKNVSVIKCSIPDMPLKGDMFDFAYSFGVLRHASDPEKGLLGVARILKKNALVFRVF